MIKLRAITFVASAMLLHCVLTSSANAQTCTNFYDDQKVTVKKDYTVRPDPACVNQKGKVHWEAEDATWRYWETLVVESTGSPFPKGKYHHDSSNPGDNVDKGGATFKYYVLVIDGNGGPHVIDPAIIINPNPIL
jgi:hypothetical protein